jgi:hypothetical protein
MGTGNGDYTLHLIFDIEPGLLRLLHTPPIVHSGAGMARFVKVVVVGFFTPVSTVADALENRTLRLELFTSRSNRKSHIEEANITPNRVLQDISRRKPS